MLIEREERTLDRMKVRKQAKAEAKAKAKAAAAAEANGQTAGGQASRISNNNNTATIP